MCACMHQGSMSLDWLGYNNNIIIIVGPIFGPIIILNILCHTTLHKLCICKSSTTDLTTNICIHAHACATGIAHAMYMYACTIMCVYTWTYVRTCTYVSHIYYVHVRHFRGPKTECQHHEAVVFSVLSVLLASFGIELILLQNEYFESNNYCPSYMQLQFKYTCCI